MRTAMRQRGNRANLVPTFVLTFMLTLLLAGCTRPSLEQSLAPQHTLARDGGVRLTLRASCLPDAPGCDLAKQRDAAVAVLIRRIAEHTDVRDAVVRADGPANIVVELPGVTVEARTATITALLTKTGASVAIVDTGDTYLQAGTNIAGETCASACALGQYRLVFTGDQIDPGQVSVLQDVPHGGTWAVQFGFAGAARQQFASYTRSHIGQYLTISVNDVVVQSAVIQSEIDGAGQITGLSESEARQLAADLKSGPLPAVMTVVTTEYVTASAG